MPAAVGKRGGGGKLTNKRMNEQRPAATAREGGKGVSSFASTCEATIVGPGLVVPAARGHIIDAPSNAK
jgi:hypothetical protein